MKIQPAGFTTFHEQDGLASDRVWSVLADRSGAVLAVTISSTDGTRFCEYVRWSQIPTPKCPESLALTQRGASGRSCCKAEAANGGQPRRSGFANSRG